MATRYPRIWLAINGQAMPCISGTVHRTSKRAASTFSAELSITATTPFGMDLTAWADYQPTDVEIIMATQAGEADRTSMMTGRIDTPAIDWANMKVSISGRDKTAKLISGRRSQKFSNQKSSEIVSTIAQAYGLNPVVTETSDYAGKQYNDDDAAHLVIHSTDFEVLSGLADREGFRWYVNGNDLVFEPKGQSSGGALQVFYSPAGPSSPCVSNVENFKSWRNMTAASPHQVNVKSFHDKDMRQYEGGAQADGVGDPVIIDHHHHRRNQSQADRLAMSRAMDAIRHDCNVSFDAPIDLSVTPRMQVEVSGTGTIYDQTYDIDTIDFTIGWGQGSDMPVVAKAAKQGRSVTQGSQSSGADAAPGDDGDS